jgi:arsenite-transporting ATPase
MDVINNSSAETARKSVLLFGGKGGVGKTTCSSAIASHLAQRGHHTLIISSDLSPSLSDVFEQPVGDNITAVVNNLDAFEISQEAILTWWKKRFGRDFSDILAHLIDVNELDKASQHNLLDYIGSAPSLREETMLDMIRDLAENGRYDYIVWDTAPAGETLNLLDMPRSIKKHLSAGAKVFEGLDRIGKQLSGRRSIAKIMDDWILASEKIARFIHDTSTFIIVANPEALVVNQVARMIQTVTKYQIPIHGLIINCVMEQAISESSIALQKIQSSHIEALKKLAGDRHIAILLRSFTEIRGFERLRKVGEMLAKELSIDQSAKH